MIVRLNHTIKDDLPFYMGRTVEMKRKVREEGNFLRETLLPFDSHTGTHLDFGAHVHRQGKFGDQYPADFFIFERVAIVTTNQINIEDEELFKNLSNDVEIILIKSGFCHQRMERDYWEKSPIISSKLADFFKKRFPNLRMIGLDFISITSQLDRSEGRKAHETLLEHFVVIEDMDLQEINQSSKIKELIVAPVFFNDMDGSPCTVFARI